MAISWTTQQKAIIDARNRSLLVSAAAGSGKTAVLSERIASLVCDRQHPVDVDRLLVVTFTRAAAAQMKERVERALEKHLEEDPTNPHLIRQMGLIRQARITTIDSFCSMVIREQIGHTDLDPAFRIADEGELKMMKEDVCSRLLEMHCKDASPEFLEFWDAANPGKDDMAASALILRLYDFSMANPRPVTWLENCRSYYSVQSAEELEGCDWVIRYVHQVKLLVQSYINEESTLLDRLGDLSGTEKHQKVIEDDLEVLERFLQAEGWQGLKASFDAMSFGRKPSSKAADFDAEAVNQLWEIRNNVKKGLSKIQKDMFFEPVEQVLTHHRLAGRFAGMLIQLTEEFIEAFGREKRSRGLADFNDLEHIALSILSEETPEGERPTAVAEEYADLFEEIMIDEYQDSNYVQELILTSISRERRGTPNLFTVGDVKQSIYRFRMARPELFMGKYHAYTEDASLHQKIELRQNFRSRADVLSGVNYFFYQIMHEELGNITYTEDTALHPGAKFEDSHDNVGGPVKMLLLDTEGVSTEDDEVAADQTASSYTARQMEALMIAREIRKVLDPVTGKKVWDAETCSYRPARCGDIAVLFRSGKGWMDDFLDMFTSLGINSVMDSGTGYFAAAEVQVAVSLLQVISNPCQDMPLSAVLLSEIGGFSDEELARMRLSVSKETAPDFYAVLEDAAAKDTEISGRVRQFLSLLQEWRRLSGFLPLHELIRMVLDDSGYYNYVSALPGGQVRRANLDMLMEKAEEFESTSYQGVYQFVRYLEKLKTYQIDYPEALPESSADAVRLMTIHKSKGLEFPIVFVAGLGKKFNQMDSSASVVLHPDFGVGVLAMDTVRRTKTPTLMKKVLGNDLSLDTLGEELRILYVAMTRAKEILYLTAATDSLYEKIRNLLSANDPMEDRLSYRELSKAKSCLEWLLPAAGRHPCFSELRNTIDLSVAAGGPCYNGSVPLEVEIVTAGDLSLGESVAQLDRNWYAERLKETEKAPCREDELAVIRRILEWNVHADDMYRLPSTLSVSELKRRFVEEEKEQSPLLFEDAVKVGSEPSDEPVLSEHYLPEFLRGEKRMTPAERGTLTHYLFEHLNPCSRESLEKQAEEMVSGSLITETELEEISLESIKAFYRTDLGKRAKKAREEGKLHMEYPFQLGVPVEEVYGNIPELVLHPGKLAEIHGIIDAWFEEDGKIILYDYKTDQISRKNGGKELTDRYAVQLRWYSRALSLILGRTVDECYLYSTVLKKAIPVSPVDNESKQPGAMARE